MAITWTQGTTHIQLSLTCQRSLGSAISLVGNTGITLKMRANLAGSSYVTLSGTPTVTDAANGEFSYKFAAGDVAVAGQYKLVISIGFSDGPINSFEQDFIISQAS